MVYSRCEDDIIRGYGGENVQFLTFACYWRHWNIEISCHESKSFLLLKEYRVWSREGIEHLVNLECIVYSAMTLFLYSDESFSCYQSANAQETRIDIVQQIQACMIFSSSVEKFETVKKYVFCSKKLSVIFCRVLKISKSCKLVLNN